MLEWVGQTSLALADMGFEVEGPINVSYLDPKVISNFLG